MRTRAAVTYGLNTPFAVREVELDDPRDDGRGVIRREWTDQGVPA